MKTKPWLVGFAAACGLLVLYVVAMTLLTRSWEATREQFTALWFLMLPLAAGFGIQVGMYTKLKHIMQEKTKATLAAGGASASVGMLACCAHHTTDVLPILGLSAAATLVARYQVPILSLSLLTNVIGIAVMWNHVRKIA